MVSILKPLIKALLPAALFFMTLSCQAKSKHAGPRDFGPYPLTELSPQEPGPGWFDPVKVVDRIQRANEAPKLLLQQTIKEAKGDPSQVIHHLLQGAMNPDSAQALLEVMRNMAPHGSERMAKELLKAATSKIPAPTYAAPLVSMKPGEPGVLVSAWVAKDTLARQGTSLQTRFDDMLLQEATRLMGFYGSTEVPKEKEKPLADGSGTAAPIHPLVKEVLRELFKKEGLAQAFASRALGQLGDLQTAKELIDHPRRFKSASISDFGPEAVRLFKDKQIDKLRKQGFESEPEFWQGVRLSYRDREVALDLAREGHGGAAMAVERHLAFEYANAKRPDERLARYLDTLIRFPGTREAFKAGQAAGGGGGLEMAHTIPESYPLSLEKELQIMDRDLAIIFGSKPWKCSDLIHVWANPLGELEYVRYQLPVHAEKWKALVEATKKIFLKHWKPRVIGMRPYQIGDDDETRNDGGCKQEIVRNVLSLYGRHLGLPPIEFEGRAKIIEDEKFFLRNIKWEDPHTYNLVNTDGTWTTKAKTPDEWLRRKALPEGLPPVGCKELGHIKEVWDY